MRLRDVVDLLLAGNIGQNNYTVIGQGTVDAALSLRPEERRGLFEEAADIKRYQLKRADALDKLAAPRPTWCASATSWPRSAPACRC